MFLAHWALHYRFGRWASARHTTITHRNDAYFQALLTGVPPTRTTSSSRCRSRHRFFLTFLKQVAWHV
jgi:hypothetical protein